MNDAVVVRIGIWAPDDVGLERTIAGKVLNRFQAEFADRIDLKINFFDTSLDPSGDASSFCGPEVDLGIFIFWSRAGDPGLSSKDPLPNGPLSWLTRPNPGDVLPDLMVFQKNLDRMVNYIEDEREVLTRIEHREALGSLVNSWAKTLGSDSGRPGVVEFDHLDVLEEALESRIEEYLDLHFGLCLRPEGPDRPWWTGKSPFAGPRAFGAERESVFFGRTRIIGELVERLKLQAAVGQCFLLVVGPPASGKSSLVRAGLLPTITTKGVIENSGLWRKAVMRPGDRPEDLFLGLALALLDSDALPELSVLEPSPEDLAHVLRANPLGSVPLVKEALAAAAQGRSEVSTPPHAPRNRLVLLVDQLEELLGLDETVYSESGAWLDALFALASSGWVWVICTLSSDFYHLTQNFPDLVGMKSGLGHFDLLDPSPADLKRSLTLAARAAGLTFEKDEEKPSRPKSSAVDQVLEAFNHHEADEPGPVLVVEPEPGLGDEWIRNDLWPRLEKANDPDQSGPLWRLARVDFSSDRQDRASLLAKALVQNTALPELTADGTTEEEISGFLTQNPLTSVPLIKGGLSQAASQFALSRGLDRQPESRLLLVVQGLGHGDSSNETNAKTDRWTSEALMTLVKSGRIETILLLPNGQEKDPRTSPSLAGLLDSSQKVNLVDPEQGRSAAPTLADRILRESTGPGNLVRMQMVLEELHQGAREGQLLMKVYDRIGGPKGVVDYRAEKAWDGVGPEARSSLAQIVGPLVSQVTQDSGGPVLKSLPRDALLTDPGSRELAEAMIQAGLLSQEQASDGQILIRVSHETLFRIWPGLQELSNQGPDKNPEEADDQEWPQGQETPSFPSRKKRFPRILWFALASVLTLAGIFGYFHLNDSWRKAGLSGSQGQDQNESQDRKNGSAIPRDQDRIQAEKRIAEFERQLAEVRNSLAFALQDKAQIALDRRLYNQALLYDLNAAIRFDPNRFTQMRSAALGRVMTCPDFPSVGVAPGDKTFQVRKFALGPDGRFLALAGKDTTIHLRDLSSNEEIRTFEGHTGEIIDLVFSADGSTLASASGDRTIRLWNRETGREKASITLAKQSLTCMDLSSDGQTIAGGMIDGSIDLWETETGKKTTTLRRHGDAVTRVCFSPNGRYLLSGANDGGVRLWGVQPGYLIQTLKKHEGRVSALAFSKSGKTLASGAADRNIRLWDMERGRESGLLEGHQGEVTGLGFHPLEDILVSSSKDRTIRVWDLETDSPLAVIDGGSSGLLGLALAGRGRLAGVLTGNGSVIVWNIENAVGQAKGVEIQGEALSAAWSPSQPLMAVGASEPEKNLLLIDPATGKTKATLTGHTASVKTVCFSPDGTLLASGSADKTVRIWDPETQREKKVLTGHEAEIYAVSFSPDGRLLASGSGDKTIRLWDVAEGRETLVLEGHSFPVLSLAFSPRIMQLASGSSDKTVRLWNVQTGQEIATLKDQAAEVYGDVSLVAFSPDGKRLAAAIGSQTNLGGLIQIWNPESQKRTGTIKNQGSGFGCLAFSRNGTMIIAGAEDGTIRIFDAQSGAEILAWDAHEDGVTSLALTPDGLRLASTDQSSRVGLWRLNLLDHLSHLDQWIQEEQNRYRLNLKNITLVPENDR